MDQWIEEEADGGGTWRGGRRPLTPRCRQPKDLGGSTPLGRSSQYFHFAKSLRRIILGVGSMLRHSWIAEVRCASSPASGALEKGW